MKTITINGAEFETLKEIIVFLGKELDFGPYFGKNLDALWDFMSTEVERPFQIIWQDASITKNKLGKDFDRLIAVFDRVIEFDQMFDEKFSYHVVE